MPNPTPTKKLDGLRSWAGLASEPFGPLNGAVRLYGGYRGYTAKLGGARHHHWLSILSWHHVDRGHDFLRRRLMHHVS